MMKSLLLTLLLSTATFAQSPLVELNDNKVANRTLRVYSDGTYRYDTAIGGRPFFDRAVFAKAPQCKVRFTDDVIYPDGTSYSLVVDADSCKWTGTVSLTYRVLGFTFTFSLVDTVVNQVPKK